MAVAPVMPPLAGVVISQPEPALKHFKTAAVNTVGLTRQHLQSQGSSDFLSYLSRGGLAAVVAVGLGSKRRHLQGRRRGRVQRRATEVEMESKTGLAPWEIEEETEEERQARYKREAEEMKLKWDARRLEEKQSAERRIAFAAREKERAQIYGPRDPIMEAYKARMYEEARVLEICRKQQEVYERTKAFKLGRPLPPKGEPYLKLKPSPVQPPTPEDFDITGYYNPQVDVDALQYKAPDSYKSPTGPAPPPREKRGQPKAAWEDPPYGPPPMNARPSNWAEVGTVTEVPDSILKARERAS